MSGKVLLTWRHHAMRQWCKKRYLSDRDALPAAHAAIASLFFSEFIAEGDIADLAQGDDILIPLASRRSSTPQAAQVNPSVLLPLRDTPTILTSTLCGKAALHTVMWVVLMVFYPAAGGPTGPGDHQGGGGRGRGRLLRELDQGGGGGRGGRGGGGAGRAAPSGAEAAAADPATAEGGRGQRQRTGQPG